MIRHRRIKRRSGGGIISDWITRKVKIFGWGGEGLERVLGRSGKKKKKEVWDPRLGIPRVR